MEGTINENFSLIGEYDFFGETFLLLLNKYVLFKTEILKAYHVPYMTKTLRKAIMKRTELETKYLMMKTDINLKTYKKQRNFCSKLYKTERRKYCNELNMNCITDNEEFSKTIKPFLGDKATDQTKIFFRMKQRLQKHSVTFLKVLLPN